MKPLLRQFCTLLAASNFDRKQIQELFYEISKGNSRQIISEIESVQRRFSNSEEEPENRQTQQAYDLLETRITDLLVREAGLTKTEVFSYLHLALDEIFPGRNVSSPNAKAGFSAWIKKLSKEFSPSELLHVATRLRNERVHGLTSKDDWLHREE
jgi:hypothetical protein